MKKRNIYEMFFLLIILFGSISFAQTNPPDEKKLGEMMVALTQRDGGKSQFYTKFYKSKTWACKPSKPIPKDGEDWTLSNFQPAIDASTKKPIDWGVNGDRFVVVDVVLDKNNRPHHVTDDILGTKNCMTFTLNLYESDGTFVKCISKWGYLLGHTLIGIDYVQEGVYHTFLSVAKLEKGSSLTYNVVDAEFNKATDWVYEDEMRRCYRSGNLGNSIDIRPIQLACKFPPKPTFDSKKTEILNKIISDSPFLQAKFYYGMVYDVGHQKWPQPNQPWSFWNVVLPIDMVNKCLIDWGPNWDRYLQFDIEFEGERNFAALTDDRYLTGKRFLIPLRLYEKDGRFVKTVSNYGSFFGFGEGSFVHIQHVDNTNTTFFTKLAPEFGKPFTYNVQRDRVSKLSQVIDFKPAQ